MATKDSKTVQIACKLPNGLVIEHPSDPNRKIELTGLNGALIIGAEYGLTSVDREFATAWFAANKEFAPVKACAIFMADTTEDVTAMAGELRKELTGFEGMRQDGKDKRAGGIKKRDDKE
jgi:hypothetical protein